MLATILIFYGCSKSAEVQPPQQVPISEPIREVKVIASCDDANNCTDDIFNNLTMQCEHRRLDHCCGDGVCDSNERCNISSRRTECPQDCALSCPGFIVVDENWVCNGKCLKAHDYYLIDGNAKFTVSLENKGELGLNGITSDFECTKSTGSILMSSTNNAPEAGVSFNGYFNSGDKDIYLSGQPYERNNATYTFELQGEPTENLNLKCSISLRASDFYYSKDLTINLRVPSS